MEEPEAMEQASLDEVKAEIKERAAEEKQASGKLSFLGSIVTAVEEHPEDAGEPGLGLGFGVRVRVGARVRCVGLGLGAKRV